MNLTPQDLARHAGLGIPGELLRDAGAGRVTDEEARALLASGTPAGWPASYTPVGTHAPDGTWAVASDGTTAKRKTGNPEISTSQAGIDHSCISRLGASTSCRTCPYWPCWSRPKRVCSRSQPSPTARIDRCW